MNKATNCTYPHQLFC